MPPPLRLGVGERRGQRLRVAAEHAAAAGAARAARPAAPAPTPRGARRRRSAAPRPAARPGRPSPRGLRAAGRERPARGVAERLRRPRRGRDQQRADRRGERDRPRAAGATSERDGGDACRRDQQRRQPLERAGVVAQHHQLGDHAGERSRRAPARGRRSPVGELRDAGADERRRERREQRHVVRVEDALRVAERDRGGEERAADGDQPAGARVGAAQAARDEHRDAGHEREAEEPAGLAAERCVEQAQRAGRRRRRRRRPPPPPGPPPAPAGPPAWPVSRPRPL